jgi:hypothetical protein
MNEELYISNYIQLVEDHHITNFRILYSIESRIMSIHLIDIPVDQIRKDYLENFKEFLDDVMQESYTKLLNENQSQDEPFSIYLKRNANLLKRKRRSVLFSENNLHFKVKLLLSSLTTQIKECNL